MAPATGDTAIRIEDTRRKTNPATFVTLFFTLLLLAAASLKTLVAVGWNSHFDAVAWVLSPYVALAVLGVSVRRAPIASIVVLGGTLITAGSAITVIGFGVMSALIRLDPIFGLATIDQWLVVAITFVVASVLVAKSRGG